MLKLILFICLLPFAMMEIFFYKQFGLVVVGFLFFVLQMQADRAANKFLAGSFGWKFPTRQSEAKRRQEAASEEEEEHIDVAPLPSSQPGHAGFYTAMRQAPAPEERPIGTPRLNRPSPFRLNAAKEAPPPPERPQAPNFRGRAHEILAIPENAATRTIKRAFRFWVKKVHPDHNHASSAANFQVQRITEAKDLLLERRRKKTAA